MATLKEVAARAGVSVMTVSNVVHGRGNMTPQTRARVHAALQALEYHPNISARRLRNAPVGVIALAFPDLANSYFSEIGNAIIAAAEARDYTVLLDPTHGQRTNESRIVHGLRPHLIDGVILSPVALEIADIQPARVGAPIVLLGQRLFGAPWDHVVIDNVAAAEQATAHLLHRGRTRIGVIGLQEDQANETAQLRLRGYTAALAAAGRAVDPALLVAVGWYHLHEGAAAMRRLLALSRPPDAVFCFNDLLAFGAMRAVHESGRRIPDDVAVVGFDDIAEARYAIPSLTTIAPDKEAIAHLAVSLLLERIAGTRTGPPECIEPAFHLMVRESTGG